MQHGFRRRTTRSGDLVWTAALCGHSLNLAGRSDLDDEAAVEELRGALWNGRRLRLDLAAQVVGHLEASYLADPKGRWAAPKAIELLRRVGELDEQIVEAEKAAVMRRIGERPPSAPTIHRPGARAGHRVT